MAFAVLGGHAGDAAMLPDLPALNDAIAAPLGSDDPGPTLGQALSSIAYAFLHEEQALQDQVEAATGTHRINRITVLRAAYEPHITTAFGIPWEATPGAVRLHLHRRVTEFASRTGDPAAERRARLATGLVSGALGHQTLEQILGLTTATRAASGTRLLQTANAAATQVHTIDPAACATLATRLALDPDDEAALDDLCLAGWRLTVPATPQTVAGANYVGSGFVAVDPATGRSHIALLDSAALGHRTVDRPTDNFPTIADTLAVGDDAERYQALLTPVRDWIWTAQAATADLHFAFAPGAATIASWLTTPGDDDPLAFLSAVLAIAGSYEAFTARPLMTSLSATPAIFNPTAGPLTIEGTSAFADAFTVDVIRNGDTTPTWSTTPTGATFATDWDGAGAADATYRIEVTANDGTRTSRPATTAAVVDTAPPAITITDPDPLAVPPLTLARDTAFVQIQGSVTDPNLDHYTVSISRDGEPFRQLRTSTHEVASGALALFVARDEQVGTYAVQIDATDRAGNTATTATTAFIIEGPPKDLTAPTLTLTLDQPSPWSARRQITVDASEDLSEVELLLDGVRYAWDTAPASTTWIIDVNTYTLPNGTHTFQATGKDLAGRTGTSATTTLTTDNFFSELKATPAAFDPTLTTTTLTGRLSDANPWQAAVLDASRTPTGIQKLDGVGTNLTIHWTVDAQSLADAPYLIEVTAGGHTAEVDILLDRTNLPPVVTLLAPADDGALITGLTPIVGTIADDPTELEWRLEVEPFGGTPTVLAAGTDPRTQATLTTFDPSTLRNGHYTLRLIARDNPLAAWVATERAIRVDGELKVGHFTLSMQDVAVNIGGIPVTVVRTYDSRDTAGGEFGPGWRLDLRAAELELRDKADVAMTLPDGRRTTFGFFPRWVAPGMYIAEYHSTSGVNDTLRPTTPLDLIETDDWFLDWDGEDYNPQSWLLTTADGTKFTYTSGKLDQVEDRDGNTLTFTEDASAITIASSRSPTPLLTLVKDPSGRVIRIEQPNHVDITYAYAAPGANAAEPLLTVTDRAGQITEFTHFLDSMVIDQIKAPGGVSVIRNEYQDGRLSKHIDADGNEILYDHDLEGRQEVVTDRNGNPTVYHYNDRGLVTTVTDPQGRRTEYEYDPDGNQTAVVDPLGRRTEYEYDAKGRVTLVRDPDLNVSTTTYDDYGRVLTSTDALGRTTTNVYDAVGRLLTTTNPLDEVVVTNTYRTDGELLTTQDEYGNLTEFDYDALGRRTFTLYPDGSRTRSAYNAKGELEWESIRMTAAEETLWNDPDPAIRARVATEYHYDDAGRLTDTWAPHPACDGMTCELRPHTQTTYNPLGQVATTIDPNGTVTRNIYDTQGRLTQTIQAEATLEQTTSTTSYDNNGQRIAATDNAGRTTRYLYDGAGRLIKTTYPDLTFTATAYDPAGRTVATTDRNGNVTQFEYDTAGRQAAVIDATGRRNESEYNPVGNLTISRDPANREIGYTYDALNRRTVTTYPDSTTTRTEYDQETYLDPNCACTLTGRVQREFDQLERKTEFLYDYAGRLIEVRQWIDQDNPGSLIVTRYSYDVRGNRLTQTDAEGRTTSFVYDRLDRLREKHYPNAGDANIEFYSYDLNGNMITLQRPDGSRLEKVYDPLGRLTRQFDPDDPLETNYKEWVVDYNDDGQREAVTRDGRVWAWTYEPLTGRLKTFTDPFARSIAYGYDPNGNRTALTTAQGTTTYEFDALNRLTKVTDRTSLETTYAYDEDRGVLDTVTYPNGTQTTYGYDPLDRVKDITHQSGLNVLASFAYTLAATGRRDAIVEQIDGVASTVSYDYDDLDRLTGEHRLGPTPYDFTFQYDAVGNRLVQDRSGTPIHYTYDDRDRLLCESAALNPTCTAPTVAYTWDANGRMTTRNSETFTWDVEDRLLQHQDGATIIAFAYDLDGIRYERTTGAGTTQFLVDANRQYQEVIEEWTGGARQMEYLHGGTGLLWQEGTGAGSRRWFHGDAQMSTRLLTDGVGAATDPFTYEAFGSDVGAAGATAYRYTGQQADAATSGYYLRARYMAPTVGRFVTIDMLPGNSTLPLSSHCFAYSHLSPIDKADPSGYFATVSVAMAAVSVTVLSTVYPAMRCAQIVPITVPIRPVILRGSGWSETAAREELRDAERTWAIYGIRLLIPQQKFAVEDIPEWINIPAGQEFPFADHFKRVHSVTVVFLNRIRFASRAAGWSLKAPWRVSAVAREMVGGVHLLGQNVAAHELGHSMAGLDDLGLLDSNDRLMKQGGHGSELTPLEARDARAAARVIK